MLLFGLFMGVPSGAVSVMSSSAEVGATSPRGLIASDVAYGIVSSLPASISLAVLFWFSGSTIVDSGAALQLGISCGVIIFIASVLYTSGAALYYLAFLICVQGLWSRRPLPWRFGRFLSWGCGVGLVRVAGIAFQFRHRELRDYLLRQAQR